MQADALQITSGGWTVYAHGDPPASVRLRWAEMPNGRLGVVELRVLPGEGRVDPDLLRSLPLGMLDSLVNHPEFASIIRETIARADHTNDLVENALSVLEPMAPPPKGATGRGEGLANLVDALDEATWRTTALRPLAGQVSTPTLRLRLGTIPKGPGKKPDAFYERVARVYTAAATQSTRPSNLIAEANEVPVTTVHGWVKEARRRGLLAPGRRSGR